MKKFALIVFVALLSSFFSVAIYKQFEQPQKVIIQEKIPAKYTSYNNATPDPLFSGKLQRYFRSSSPTNFINAAESVTPAVVNIRSFNSGGFDLWNGNIGGSSGSGVIVSPDGYIITNNHVIEDGKEIEVTLNDKREFSAELVGSDPTTDLALLKVVSDNPLPFIVFGNSDSVRVGEWVLAVGNPFNLESTVTAGIVSAKGRNIDILEGDYKIESFIQTDAAVNPGNSGGALVNTNGELVGINTAIITRSGRYEGYSFAVPANLARKVVHDLKEYGLVQRAILGVIIEPLNDQQAKDLGLISPEGVYITKVFSNGAADDAGMESGDIILAVDGKRVNSVPELQENIAQFRPGEYVRVEYLRYGKRLKADVLLKNLKNKTTLLPPVRDDDVLQKLGFELRNLSTKELDRLRLNSGVIVNSVIQGSTIETTNMDPGFIITKIYEIDSKSGDNVRKINQFQIANVDDVVKAFTNISSGFVLLEGVYESFPGEWGYKFELRR